MTEKEEIDPALVGKLFPKQRKLAEMFVRDMSAVDGIEEIIAFPIAKGVKRMALVTGEDMVEAFLALEYWRRANMEADFLIRRPFSRERAGRFLKELRVDEIDIVTVWKRGFGKKD